MKKHKFIVLFVTAVALGSGFANVFSVVGPSLPDRMAQRQQLFPRELAHHPFTDFEAAGVMTC